MLVQAEIGAYKRGDHLDLLPRDIVQTFGVVTDEND